MKPSKLFFMFFCWFCIGYLGQHVYSYLCPKYNEKRILVMISSWKRPLLLSGQIIRFEKQTYRNFDMSVSVKGASEEWVRATFMQEWQDMINSDKLRIRFDDNKDQLANVLDTVRDVNLDDYDYFCKVDDDDWYAPTYLEEVNEWLNKEDNITLSHSKQATLLRNGDDAVWMGFNTSVLSGPTMCFDRRVIDAALKIEKDPAALEPLYSKDQVLALKEIKEDAMLHQIAEKLGKSQYRMTSPHNIIYGQQYPSVIRGNYLNKK